MPRGPPKKPDKVSAVNTSLQGQKPRGRPKKTDIVNAESSPKGGKKNTYLQGQKNKANPETEGRKEGFFRQSLFKR